MGIHVNSNPLLLFILAGTASTKTLGQVRGTSAKAFPQKGRGKARVGSIRAPQIRGG